MNIVMQWVLGLILLVTSPFILLILALITMAIKLPLWSYLLYKEILEGLRKNAK